MLVLAFDCSSSMSIALIRNNSILQQKFFEHEAKHSENLVLEIKDLISKHNFCFDDLDLIIATNGPGSYTGIRVALAVLKMFKITLKKPCITVNCCEVVANKYIAKSSAISVAIRGNLHEVFYAKYGKIGDELKQISAPTILNFDEVAQDLKRDEFLCGSANQLFLSHDFKSHAQDLIFAEDVWHYGKKFFASTKARASSDYSQNSVDEIFSQISPLYLRDPKITLRKQ